VIYWARSYASLSRKQHISIRNDFHAAVVDAERSAGGDHVGGAGVGCPRRSSSACGPGLSHLAQRLVHRGQRRIVCAASGCRRNRQPRHLAHVEPASCAALIAAAATGLVSEHGVERHAVSPARRAREPAALEGIPCATARRQREAAPNVSPNRQALLGAAEVVHPGDHERRRRRAEQGVERPGAPVCCVVTEETAVLPRSSISTMEPV